MSRRVIGIHLVCRGGENVKDIGDGRFKSGYWKISEEVARNAEYLALHENKNTPSYIQGAIEGYGRIDDGSDRIFFYVRKTSEPKSWVGGGTGEKGYLWSDDV
ncbi:hypothetical protein [Spirulina sp. 06S082]|uniref:hypothetical protein n=1 Tax=Spirulina sp. 06S082 TaxID=3110248 RepID=UPI002B20DB88|nr:hypothetical protein [Spirulina sp. 06S082]MEA5470684.1 hypothetical protein [Spirulina sp. 06S082]